MPMPIFRYLQNNSGGHYLGDHDVIFIEAPSREIANRIANSDFGVYFNGTEDGTDCPCCGDRWSDYPDMCEENFLESCEFFENHVQDSVPIFLWSKNEIKYIVIN